jgi:hypothetical protein
MDPCESSTMVIGSLDRPPRCTIDLWLDVLQLEAACMTQLSR